MTDRLTDAVVDIATQLRRLADHLTTDVATNPDTPTTTHDNGRRVAHWRPVPLATPCAYCAHPYNWHASRGTCEFGNETNRCGCRQFMLGPVPPPVDPRSILGIDEETEDRAAKYEHVAKELEAELEQARRDVESSDHAARRAMEQRQQMATERYALQEQCEQLDAEVYRVRKLLDQTRAAACREDAEHNATRAERAEQRAAAMERAMESTAADALKHRGCHRDLMAQCTRAETAEQRLKHAHQARRAKVAQLDDIKRALIDTGIMAEGDPYGHADLADVIRQTIPDAR